MVVMRDALSELAKLAGPRALRDRALLLVGFAGALRRSELVALDVADLRFVAEGVVLALRRRKTDQEGHGTEIAIPYGQSERTCCGETAGAAGGWLRSQRRWRAS